MGDGWKFMSNLLNKPGTLHMAQRMMNSNSRLVVRRCSAHDVCWLCLLEASESPVVCGDMHWTCILSYLASKVVSPNEDLTITSPRYYLLPSLVQKNLLVLLSRCSDSIPLLAAIDFLNALKNASQNDHWLHFLLSKVFRLLNESEIEQKSQMGLQDTKSSEAIHIALTDTLMGKISNLGRRFVALEHNNTCTGGSSTITKIDINLITGVTVYEGQDARLVAKDVPNQGNGRSHAPSLRFEYNKLVGKKRSRADDDSPGDNDDSHFKKAPLLKDKKSFSPTKVIEFAMAMPEVKPVSGVELETGSSLKESWLRAELADESTLDCVMALDSIQLCSVMEVSPSLLLEDVVVAATKNESAVIISLVVHVSFTDVEMAGAPSSVCVANLVAVSKIWIVPWLRARTECLSRAFTSAMVSFLDHHFTATIDGVVIPILKDDNIGTVQADFICKLVRDDLTIEQSTVVFRKFISIEQNIRREQYVWNEVITTIAQVFIGKKVNIESGDIDGVLKVLRKSSHSLCMSIKFGMFMKHLMSGYSHVFRSHAPAFLDMANSHKSSMKGLLIKCAEKLVN